MKCTEACRIARKALLKEPNLGITALDKHQSNNIL